MLYTVPQQASGDLNEPSSSALENSRKVPYPQRQTESESDPNVINLPCAEESTGSSEEGQSGNGVVEKNVKMRYNRLTQEIVIKGNLGGDCSVPVSTVAGNVINSMMTRQDGNAGRSETNVTIGGLNVSNNYNISNCKGPIICDTKGNVINIQT